MKGVALWVLGIISVFVIFGLVLTTTENQHVANPKISVYDGCQYIVNSNNYGSVMTHKGNCNNPIHPENRK